MLLFPGRNGDKGVGFIFFCFFGICFSGVTFTLVPTIKPDSPVDEDKEDLTEAVSLYFRNTNYSGAVDAGASN